MAGRMYLGNEMVTPAIVSGGVDSVNGQTGEVVLTASDVNALPDTTKYAKTLGLSMNQTTFVLSWQLYDQNGDPIGQVQTVDLPLESVVVNATYDATNKKIVLTLENGTTVDVPVGDLVEGLQSEITITNMLSSDLVNDTNKTHKFVTAEEKTTWNNKQNAISDLATIRAGASAGATAVQPAAIANMQTTTNLVTEVDDESTDTEYPSAKAVYNVQLDLEDRLDDEARVRTRMDNELVDRMNRFYDALVPRTTTVNGKALSSSITLDASDVGALPDSTVIPTVNNSTITVKQGGISKGSFTLNQDTNSEINLSANIKGLGVPDFTNRTSLSSGTTHTISEDGWLMSNGSVRLNSSTGTQILSGGALVWVPIEQGQVIYVSGTTAYFYPLTAVPLNVPDYTNPTSLVPSTTHTIPFTGWLMSNGSVRLNSSSGTQILSGGTLVTVPIQEGQVIYVSGTSARLFPCKA